MYKPRASSCFFIGVSRREIKEHRSGSQMGKLILLANACMQVQVPYGAVTGTLLRVPMRPTTASSDTHMLKDILNEIEVSSIHMHTTHMQAYIQA
jgi:hypothetical protein